VPGEICIAGHGLARGYWRDPGRTHAAFLHHPRTGERLYRTGDFGRYRPSGDIEFLGRRDAQVKVHGHRIELGEVEAALERHPAVRSAVADARHGAGGEPRLVAWFVAEDPGAASERELREHVARLLPRYMVPAAVVRVDRVPLNSNGKVARGALPDPRAAGGAGAAAGRGSSRVRELVRETLGVDDVGGDVALVDLGVDSMDLVRLAVQLEAQLGTRPDVESLLGGMTGDGLCELYAADDVGAAEARA
jgi:acyl carrier protein